MHWRPVNGMPDITPALIFRQTESAEMVQKIKKEEKIMK